MNHIFHSAHNILEISKNTGMNLAQICLEKELQLTKKSKEEVLSVLSTRLKIMKRSIEKGMEAPKKTMGGMGGADAFRLKEYFEKNGYDSMIMSETALKAGMYAIANNENNACMGCIVACPTAGSSGVTPGVFFATQERFGFTDEQMLDGFLVAAGIGSIISEVATVAGAEGGCQAEIGSAVAMAAAGLTFMRGGSTEQCLHAAALGLKNLLGLACDPIGGMVEVPCIKRNAFAAQYALFGSDLAMMGVQSFIPFDEVVEALKNIGNMMSTRIRETALGGLAITKTGKGVNERLGIKIEAVE